MKMVSSVISGHERGFMLENPYAHASFNLPTLARLIVVSRCRRWLFSSMPQPSE